ncbi:hypothetical protein AVEN_40016-1 [Araneus ventricosus]|uniref:DUF7041 domain-containing protein n=1 Tax=Araneus ventricosus TaxID=182803 RepID=A0A4Y2VA18_ARAVE|nr:hypothetical protein AVEN_228060-1 [Araneus ventricosus]GBO20577.1 hypothetical protein AVEN_40016-1 [Araneus ventricosus]
MVEATFELAVPKPITSSITKYNYCGDRIAPEAAAIVPDAIVSPDRMDPYKHLKEAIIKRCGESNLTSMIRNLNPTNSTFHNNDQFFVNTSLNSSSYVFLRIDKVRPPLTHPYSGPHLVKSRSVKKFVIDLSSKNVTVTIDRYKPAYKLSKTIHSGVIPKVTLNDLPKEQSRQTDKSDRFKNVRITRYGRHVHFPKRMSVKI